MNSIPLTREEKARRARDKNRQEKGTRRAMKLLAKLGFKRGVINGNAVLGHIVLKLDEMGEVETLEDCIEHIWSEGMRKGHNMVAYELQRAIRII
ncbi:MAG: hypothetical protein RLZZ182_1502 [Pseudomonadota bacterium]|jgi:hypothetical protein